MDREREEYMEGCVREKGKARERKQVKCGERERREVSLNWESITEAWVEQPLSVSRKHTEMCSSAQAL